MAYRPDPSVLDHPLTADQVKELHRNLSMLSPGHVRDAYDRAYEECKMAGDRLPRAAAIQELVAAWKVMRAWRRRRAPGRG